VTRAAEDRPGRGAAHEEEPGEKQGASDDGRSRVSDERCERAADREAYEATRVLAQEGHEPEDSHPHSEPERTDVEQVASCKQQPSEHDERDRKDVGRVPDDVRQHAREPRADGAPVETDVEDRGEDEPEGEQRKAEELVLVL
jgi:hypothetical protein